VNPNDSHADRIVGESPVLRAILDLVDRVAEAPVTVLITGESGTGKDLVAREIHERGSRSSGPFVAVGCAAMPANLLEAELFGYEKGAFTDAKIRKKGLLELGDRGTVFLDEIGLMPPDLQAKLLSVLESLTFRRVGGIADIRVDIRFVAATNEDLEAAVSTGRFRQDLYYRLNVVQLHIPPLRERGHDVLLIAQHFLKTYVERYGRSVDSLSPEAEGWLARHPFPGNVRELRNVIERAVLLCPGPQILPEDLALGTVSKPREDASGGAALEVTGLGEIRVDIPPWGIALEDIERKVIERALVQSGGNITLAARLLHVSRDTLRYRIKKHRLPPPSGGAGPSEAG